MINYDGFCDIYTIHYNYGSHNLDLEVYSYEFNRLLDELSSEFEISIDSDEWDSIDFEGFKSIQTYYFITDYCGNKYKIAEHYQRKLKS